MNWQQISGYGSDLIKLDASQLTPAKGWLVKTIQCAYAVARDLLSGQIQLHAMSLVYTALLSIVPLLALSVSVLKSFGVHNQLEPVLLNFLKPMGPKGLELSSQIISFVENMNVAVLGSVGIALLFYTAISLIQKVEGSFNYIWRVKHRRTLAQQLSHYLSVLMVGPVLLASLVGVVASTMNTQWVQYLLSFDTAGILSEFSTRVLPLLAVTALITSVYMFIPNTKVRLYAALPGALFAAVSWKAGGAVFSSFVVSSTQYDAIYSGFAIAMMLMIWLFLSWLILLVGANLSFYWQNPTSIHIARDNKTPAAGSRRQLGLNIMVNVAQHFHDASTDCTLETLAHQMVVPASDVASLIEIFEQHKLLISANTGQQHYVPGRDIDAISIAAIIQAVEGDAAAQAEPSSVDVLLATLEQQRNDTLNGQSLRTLIKASEPAPL
ncbi:MAG: YihY/virulence factor BrkB family protein [Pseudomonadales bacterium]|nr:YihY/virulence factor BrkB family protein [Pseudomonadales bacterium]